MMNSKSKQRFFILLTTKLQTLTYKYRKLPLVSKIFTLITSDLNHRMKMIKLFISFLESILFGLKGTCPHRSYWMNKISLKNPKPLLKPKTKNRMKFKKKNISMKKGKSLCTCIVCTMNSLSLLLCHKFHFKSFNSFLSMKCTPKMVKWLLS